MQEDQSSSKKRGRPPELAPQEAQEREIKRRKKKEESKKRLVISPELQKKFKEVKEIEQLNNNDLFSKILYFYIESKEATTPILYSPGSPGAADLDLRGSLHRIEQTSSKIRSFASENDYLRGSSINFPTIEGKRRFT